MNCITVLFGRSWYLGFLGFFLKYGNCTCLALSICNEQNQTVFPSYKQIIRAGALHWLHWRNLSQTCCPTLCENYFLSTSTLQNLHLTMGSSFYNCLALWGAWTLWEEGWKPWGKEDSALLPHNVPLWLLLIFRAPCGGWGEGAIIGHCSLLLIAFLTTRGWRAKNYFAQTPLYPQLWMRISVCQSNALSRWDRQKWGCRQAAVAARERGMEVWSLPVVVFWSWGSEVADM